MPEEHPHLQLLMRRLAFAVGLIVIASSLNAPLAGAPATSDNLIQFTDDGGWCWFEDPRAIVHQGKLIIGVVSSGYKNPSNKGDIRAVVYDLRTGGSFEVELFDKLQLDDHDSPVFLSLPDGSVLTLFAKHHDESFFYFRISEPGDLTRWGPIERYIPSKSTHLTYSNIFLLPAEKNRVYNFFRGLDDSFKPSYAYSDNLGQTWQTGSVFINVPTEQRHRPYVRYASDGVSTVHMIYTEGHPMNCDNSIYHIFYRGGELFRSDGSRIASLSEGLSKPELGTLVYQGDADNVAWTVDIELDRVGRPSAAYSVQIGSAGLPPGQGGEDHRYRFAHWDGHRWQEEEMAYAGNRLYPGQEDYTGLVALFPGRPHIAFVSTDVNPESGEPLISDKDGKRHYEIFKGQRSENGHWGWAPVTENSVKDNLRPIIPKPSDGRTAVLWLRGEYRTYTDYSLEVVGMILEDAQP